MRGVKLQAATGISEKKPAFREGEDLHNKQLTMEKPREPFG